MNTAVQDIIDRARHLTKAQGDALVRHYRGMSDADLDRISRIVNEHWGGWRGAGGKAFSAAERAAGKSAAWESMHSVGEAALAVAVRDKISSDEFVLLTQAWRAAVGPIQ